MELLRPFLIIGLMQILSFTSGNPVTTISPKESFLDFYDQELSSIAEKFCEKALNLSEKLLKDKEINEASSAPLKEFKEYLEHLQQDYPHFKRYKLYQPLLAIIMNAINIEIIHKFDKDYEDHMKFKQIFKQKFTEILEEYEQNYTNFIQEKCLPKMEELKQNLKEEDLQKMPKFTELLDNLKSCQNYTFLPTYLDAISIPMNISQDIFIKYAKSDFKKAVTLVALRISDYGPSLLNSEKFLQLSKETQTKLIEDVNDFNTKFNNNNDIDKFVQLFGGEPHFPKKYENSENFPSEDREILKEMLKKMKSGADTDTYEKAIVEVLNDLSTKMIHTFWLIPEEELKPHYKFLGLPV